MNRNNLKEWRQATSSGLPHTSQHHNHPPSCVLLYSVIEEQPQQMSHRGRSKTDTRKSVSKSRFSVLPHLPVIDFLLQFLFSRLAKVENRGWTFINLSLWMVKVFCVGSSFSILNALPFAVFVTVQRKKKEGERCRLLPVYLLVTRGLPRHPLSRFGMGGNVRFF